MARMFYEREDENGVTVDCNAHPSSDYEPRKLKPYQTHLMMNSAGRAYFDDKPATIEHEVGDQVLSHVAQPKGAMTFGSVLAREEKR